jgi:phage tail-like protein
MSFGKLEIKFADGTSAVIELTKPQMMLGRSADVEIPVNDNQISRRHALFLCEADGVRVVDTGSANGTFLSGARLPAQQPVPLADGAQLRVGQTLIKFVASPRAADKKVTTAVKAKAVVPPPLPTEVGTPVNTPEKPDETSVKRRAPTFAPTGAPTSVGSPVPSPLPTEVGTTEPQRAPVGMPLDQSSYLKYLPAFFGANEFLGRFLLIFEHLLTPLDRQIEHLADYFDPRLAPPDFLPWLASWLGLVLDERWPEGQRRELIRAAVDLYDWRGTRRGLSEFVRLYTGCTPEITEPGIGKGAKADQAHRFSVRVKVPDAAQISRDMLESIIDLEKPAHAGYTLEVTR